MVTLSIRSTGNTDEPVSGTVRIKGPLGTRQGSVKATRMLPGKTIALGVVSAKGLQAGAYTATVSLKQGTLRDDRDEEVRVHQR